MVHTSSSLDLGLLAQGAGPNGGPGLLRLGDPDVAVLVPGPVTPFSRNPLPLLIEGGINCLGHRLDPKEVF